MRISEIFTEKIIRYNDAQNISGGLFGLFLELLGYFLVNDLQTPPPSKRADGEIFLAYVSDDFKTKKIFFEKKMSEFFFLNVGLIAEMPSSANLFRLGSSNQNHAGFKSAALMGGGRG